MNVQNTETSIYDSAVRHILQATVLLSPLVFYPFIHNISNLPKASATQLGISLSLFIWSLRFRKHHLSVLKHSVYLPLGLWLFLSGISLLWATDWFSGFTLWCHWTICALAIPIVINTMKKISDIDHLMLFCTVGAGLISIIGCLQYTVGLSMIPQAYIPSGTFFNRNVMAQYLVMIIPISLMLFLLNRKKHLHGLYALMFALQLVVLLYTKTRAAWLAMLVSILLVTVFSFFTGFSRELKSFLSKEKLLYLAVSIMIVIFLANFPQYGDRSKNVSGNTAWAAEKPREGSNKKHQTPQPKDIKRSGYSSTLLSISRYNEGSGRIRLVMWVNSIGMLQDYFLTGTGLANFYIHYPRYHTYLKNDPVFSLKNQPTHLHNDFFQLALEISPLGLITFLSILFIVFLRFLTAFRLSDTPDIKLRLLFLIMAVCAFSVDAIFSFPLRMALPPFYLMIILGMIAAIDISVSGSPQPLPLFSRQPVRTVISLIAAAILLTAGYFNITQMIADHHYLKSAYFNAKKKWDIAIHEAEKSVKRIPWRYPPWYELATACEQAGLLDKTISAYEKTLTIHPFLVNAQLKLSNAYLKQKNLKKAEFRIDQAVELMPELDLVLYQKGVISENIGDTRQARQYYQKVIDVSPGFAEAYYRLGVINLSDNHIETSKKQLEKALALKPDIKKIHFQLGNVNTKLNRLDDAEKEFRKELHLRPENANAYTGLGLAQAKQHKWDQAVSSFKKAIELNPNSGEAHMNLAVTYFYAKKYDLSLKHADIAESLNIPNATILIRKLDQAMAASE